MDTLNRDVLNNVYKNAHIAMQSISDVMPEVSDADFLNELSSEYDGYDNFIGDLAAYMKDVGVTPVDVNVFAKAMMWTSIKMKTVADDSASHVADMMLKGTIMGISELMQLISRGGEKLDPTVKDYTRRLIDIEEQYESKLKTYL